MLTAIYSVNKRSLSCAFILIISALGGISTVGAADLVVMLENIKDDQGIVRVAVFDVAKDFPRKPKLGLSVAAKPGSVSVTFRNLSAGIYAVSGFQDVNGNKKLDTNTFGMPIEPYGFSRDARGRFGPPAFEEVAIQVDSANPTVIRFPLR